MEIKVDTGSGPSNGPCFEDAEGFNLSEMPGNGSRRIPLGDFPTGPEVRNRLPDIVATDQSGRQVDVHADRIGQPAVVVFSRSAVSRCAAVPSRCSLLHWIRTSRSRPHNGPLTGCQWR